MIIKVEEIEAEVIKKDVRRINMRIYPDGKIKISAPKRLKNSEVEPFICERLDWIRQTKEKLSHKKYFCFLFDYSKDNCVFLFGEKFELEKNLLLPPGIHEDKNKIIVGAKNLLSEKTEKLFDVYFKKLLFEKLSVLVAKWEEITGLKASSWSIKKVKSYWGKCKVKTREIIFNQNLVHYPNECIEYVVLHELAHIRYPDHQRGFKDFLSKYMPDWKRISNILK